MAVKPRFDKTDPNVGSFRAMLAVDWPDDDVNKVWFFGLNASGLAVKGAGASGLMGFVIRTKKGEKAGDAIDIHTSGEIYPFVETNGTLGVAGTKYYAHADGTVDTVSASGTLVGIVTSDLRLVYRRPI